MRPMCMGGPAICATRQRLDARRSILIAQAEGDRDLPADPF